MTFKKAGLVLLATTCTIAASSVAAPRKVMFEQFTASWCGPCQSVGYALGDLTDDYPNSFQSVQMHIWSSAYGFDDAWCESRASYYGVNGIPTTQVDGVIKKVGTSGQAGDYNAFLGYLNQRLNVPSDVSISLSGQPADGNNYQVSVDISLESGAPSQTMVIRLGYSLDAECGYPQSGIYYYDTHVDHLNEPTITLGGGESTTIDHTFTLNSTAATNANDITFYCFAQEPGSNGSGNNLEILNMGFMDFTVRPPDTFTVKTDGSGDFTEIQDALDNAINGDIILVSPGTYYERLQFNGANCTLKSTDGPETTIIDAQQYNIAVRLLSGGSEIFDGFTVMNGFDALGSGLMTNGNPLIKNCIFRDNASTGDYIIFSLGNPTVQDNYFCSNSSDNIGPNWTDGGGNVFEDECPDEPCPGDLTGDGVVNVNDVLAVISEWGTANGDVDGDGATTVNDILLILSVFGESC
ncbi:MAG: hypothetical protein MK089_07765 [Phycisphaerales bacterium]|nr:hypothetical protein [Phycisphaerales bacterium]